METHGSAAKAENNHPIVNQDVAVLHNGIIVNAEVIWQQYPNRTNSTDVDSEVLCLLIRETLENCASREPSDVAKSLQTALSAIKGSYSFIATAPSLDFALTGTNTGSLWIATQASSGSYAIASEQRILTHAFAACNVRLDEWEIKQATVHAIAALPLQSPSAKVPTPLSRPFIIHQHALPTATQPRHATAYLSSLQRLLDEGYSKARAVREAQRHCKRCILPASMPLITFDHEGICNYCRGHNKIEVAGRQALVEQLRQSPSGVKTIVPFSGGRDSSFALHLLKKELNIDVVAFTYDWGVLTDLGRRNQARMIGKLGVEQILVSADIKRKREYVRKNVSAWLRKPNLGMVPLFMAGDKHYFYHLHQLRRNYPGALIVYADNQLERSYFKYGFAGVANKLKERKPYDIGWNSTANLLAFYAKQFLTNPGYWNNSIVDTLSAYWASYFVPKNFLHIYQFIRWDERNLVDTLVKEYEWELAEDTASSWRIGDGTAAFYNYIYFVMGGLTEHDTFRSNQIREGIISREEALSLALEEASPRADSMSWYFETLGIDPELAIRTINSAALSLTSETLDPNQAPGPLEKTFNAR